MTSFEIECFHNMYLPRGGTRVNVVVTVTAQGADFVASAPQDRSEILIVDTSGSMDGDKLREAKAATVAAIAQIPDGVRFGVIAGSSRARLAYPSSLPLAMAWDETRREAQAAVHSLEAKGGTAMGRWIALAAESYGTGEGIRHAILLTDGKNESEPAEALDASLEQAKGMFQCDCRGVGADWNVAELRKVASALTGTCDIIEKPEAIEASFATLLRDSLRKEVADVRLRVWTPQGASVAALKQMEPYVDLVANRIDVGPLVGEYSLGSWGSESRDVFLSVLVPPQEPGEEMMAARVTLVVDGNEASRCGIPAAWTDDEAKSTGIPMRLAEVLGDEELVSDVQRCVDSFRVGDRDSAIADASRAVRKAYEAGNAEMLDLLSQVVDIDDPATGRVHHKPKVEKMDMMRLESRSTLTKRTRPPVTPGGDPGQGGGS